MTVTFFGHKNAPDNIESNLESTIISLIENYDANLFYVGNQGYFDSLANRILRRLSKQYPHIKHYTVLAYMPQKPDNYSDFSNTILPEAVAISHPKYAISKRNDWMLSKSDAVIAYVTHSYGGAAQYYQKAIRQKKTVINLAESAKSS